MECCKTKKGVSLITLVITIVVIIILASMAFIGNDKTIDEAGVAKFKQEITEIKRVVDTKKLINSKQGLDEEIINKGFDKVLVKDPPGNFVSVDEDKLSAYIIRLNDIDYEDLKTGQQYKKVKSGDTVTFDKDDIYIYDKVGTVFYLKGIYIEGSGTLYTADETRVNGPLVSAENTTGGIVQVKVTPTNGGEITSVVVGTISATKISEGIYEAEVDKNGSYVVTATEEGSGTSRTTVNVTKIADNIPETVIGAPIPDYIRINNGEAYTKYKTATLYISGDADLIYIKRYTTGAFPTTPTASSTGWQNYTTEVTLNNLVEGENSVFVWFRNKGNNTFIPLDTSIILDTKAPTTDKPDVEVYDEHSFRITAKQEDYGSGLAKLQVGYKLAEDTEYKWIDIPDLVAKTIQIENNMPNRTYQIKTRAVDKVGNESESYEHTTALNDIPMGVKIEYNPTTGWTKRSTVTITYPSSANDIYQKWYRLAGGEWKITNNFVETIYIEENMTIEAVVVKKMAEETLFGEITSVTITNIDNKGPIVTDLDFDPINVINNEDYRGYANLIDNESGIVAYTINNSPEIPITWNYLKQSTKEMAINFDVMVGTEYYIWVKDAAENISNQRIEKEKIDATSSRIKATLSQTEYIYSGLENKPAVTVEDTERGTLKEGIHYSLEYKDTINVGTAKVIITTKRAYEGVIEPEYTIKPATPTLTLTNATHNYDRNTKTVSAAVATGTPNGTIPNGTITYKYYTNSTLTTLTTATNGATTQGGPPSKEGTYYVVAHIAAAGNYTEATSNTATLTIQPSPMTVTFNANGGSVSQGSRTVYYDHTYGENGALPTPTRTNYDFLGWYDATSGGNRIYDLTNVSKNQNHTIYARWRGVAVTVSFDSNCNLSNPSSKTVYYNETYGTLSSLSRSGYSFDGWYYNGSRKTSSSKVTIASNHTLTASWTKLAYACDCGGCNEEITEGEYCSTCSNKTVCNGCSRRSCHYTICNSCGYCEYCGCRCTSGGDSGGDSPSGTICGTCNGSGKDPNGTPCGGTSFVEASSNEYSNFCSDGPAKLPYNHVKKAYKCSKCGGGAGETISGCPYCESDTRPSVCTNLPDCSICGGDGYL